MTTARALQPAAPQDAPRTPPPLESGMRLTSQEFERRYDLYPGLRAELIERVVYVASPAHEEGHSHPQHMVSGWLAAYEASHKEVRGGAGGTVRLDPDNNVQPDAYLRYREGTSRTTDDDYLEGPPEFVFEIAASSASIDMGAKKHAYRRAGVQEYVVWQVYENQLDWFALEEGEYVPLEPDEHGVIESRVFPGLRLPVEKLLARDLAGVLAAGTPAT